MIGKAIYARTDFTRLFDGCESDIAARTYIFNTDGTQNSIDWVKCKFGHNAKIHDDGNHKWIECSECICNS